MLRKIIPLVLLLSMTIVYAQNHAYGEFDGNFSHGNFSTELRLEIKNVDGTDRIFFTSPEQNAYGIPAQEAHIESDSVSFVLQSDFFRYKFDGIVEMDSIHMNLAVENRNYPFILVRNGVKIDSEIQSQDISFKSGGLELHGTVHTPKNHNGKAIYIVTSSGNQDRSASRAEALFFAGLGYISMHMDKRGTGQSEGNWQEASIEELCSDDLEAISYLSQNKELSYRDIGLKGSSQGAAKVPYILSKKPELGFGIIISCPASTLLESDLNYWRNRTREQMSEDDLDRAEKIQRAVFDFIAGNLAKGELDSQLEMVKNEPWLSHVWVPELDSVRTDRKLNYTPVPYFEGIEQPLLVIQGSSDEIIPAQSFAIIRNLTEKSNSRSEYVWLEKADHAMMFKGESDFPYWPSLHPEYRKSISTWLVDLER